MLGSCGKPREAEALFKERRPLDCLGAGMRIIVFGIVHKMAANTVGTEANGVESATGFGLIFRVPAEVSQFFRPVGKLTFVTVFAHTPLGKCAAQFCLVAG